MDQSPDHETTEPAALGVHPDGTSTAATFADLGLRAELLAALDGLGYEEPTPIQLATIPPLIEGADLVGQAATGTGKTAAFALPLLHRLGERHGHRSAPEALVLVPTRELAMQVSEAIFKYGRRVHDGRGVRVVPIYGGQPIQRQLHQLDRGVDVVVATPGRAVDHIGRGSLPLGDVRVVVLDEADEMLDMGFADDLEAILAATPEDRQTVLFSATMPARITSIAKRYQRDPARIRVGASGGRVGTTRIDQRAYVVQRAHKPVALGRILDLETPTATLVFCRTRGEVDELTVTMNGRGYRAEALHGGMDQQQRDRVLQRLRDGAAELLIATDVAARGLDVDVLTHVVNYDVPSAPESYVHRIGRVGRAGRRGVAITLAEPREQRLLANIERATKQSIGLATVPSGADLREQRLEQLATRLVEAVDRRAADAADAADANDPDDDGDPVAGLVARLSAAVGATELAIAAVGLLDETATADDDELDIPDARRFQGAARPDRTGRHRDERPPRRSSGSLDERSRDNDEPTGFLHIGLGRRAGVRPGDLVGAIANEVGVPGRQIGPIRIADTYSVVGLPERVVEQAIGALRDATVRGKPFRVRRYTP